MGPYRVVAGGVGVSTWILSFGWSTVDDIFFSFPLSFVFLSFVCPHHRGLPRSLIVSGSSYSIPVTSNLLLFYDEVR